MVMGINQTQQQQKFIIDDKDFFCDGDLIHSHQFIVRSIPKNYSVIDENNNAVFSTITTLLNQNKKNVLLIDANIFKLYKPILDISPNRILMVEATEKYKSLESVTHTLNFFQKNDITKSEHVIVVGGGITQEITGFSCAIYKRGIPWIYFPTTLLSMSDSCLGGKASVNYNGVKNQLGLFSTPIAIYINHSFLKTLSDTEINSGLGEILKSCIIGGSYFLNLYQEKISNGKVKSFSDFKPLIFASLTVKKTIVEADEFESNYRRVLNYGHTFGHAIEALSDFKISHGEAVVAGMILANKLSHEQGLLSSSDVTFLNQLCADLLSEETISALKTIKFDNITHFILQDKKATNQKVTFVLAKSPGNIQFEHLDPTPLQISW